MENNYYKLISSPFINTSFTKRMFHFLLKKIKPDIIFDIGSRDGRDSLAIRKKAPDSTIIAFEANPNLYNQMIQNNLLTKNKINVVGTAIADYDGEAKFKIFNNDRGTGSLLNRLGKKDLIEYEVNVCRLDTYCEKLQKNNIALWIDVEGSSYEVIKGSKGLIKKINLIHCEIESEALFEGETLAPDLEKLMNSYGFIDIDGGIIKNHVAGNKIYLKKEFAEKYLFFISITLFKIYLHLYNLANKIGIIKILILLIRPFKKHMDRAFLL